MVEQVETSFVNSQSESTGNVVWHVRLNSEERQRISLMIYMASSISFASLFLQFVSPYLDGKLHLTTAQGYQVCARLSNSHLTPIQSAVD